MPTLPLLLLACNISSTIEPEEPVGGGLRQIEIAAPEVDDDTGDASADAALAEELAPEGPPPLEDPGEARWAEYDAPVAKPLLDAQPWRQVQRQTFSLDDTLSVQATLTNPNPRINRWFVLDLQWSDGRDDRYHLESNAPELQVTLDARNPHGPVFVRGDEAFACALWPSGPEQPLLEARADGAPFVDLCEGLVALRNPTEGRKSTKEWASDFLRDNFESGEEITVFIRDTFFSGSYVQTSEVEDASGFRMAPSRQVYKLPADPRIDPAREGATISPGALGLPLVNADQDRVEIGRWYALEDQPGIYVSAIQAGLVDPEIVAAQAGQVSALSDAEAGALVVMVAFDLDQFELEYALGTDHPRLDWSSRVPAGVVDPSRPGPDGFDTSDPLVRTGKVHRRDFDRIAASFTGGFKRSHGAFKHTELSTTNDGSHYGFIEDGVVFSKPQPGLSTLIVWEDGAVELKTWSADDDAQIGRILHARQNGVPILTSEPDDDGDPSEGASPEEAADTEAADTEATDTEATDDGAPDEDTDAAGGAPTTRPGDLVMKWGEGNWSGSVDGELQSIRGSLCSHTHEGTDFLIYGWYTGATPSGMARVSAAYGCDYAMLTDMNALEHTYLATYTRDGDDFEVYHLDQGMDVLDKSRAGVTLPRFVAFADNRDFFYLLRKDD